MQPLEHDSLANSSIHNSQADAGLAEQALADFAKSQQLSRKNAAQLIFGHDQADPKANPLATGLFAFAKTIGAPSSASINPTPPMENPLSTPLSEPKEVTSFPPSSRISCCKLQAKNLW